jgi:hypothetical protein
MSKDFIKLFGSFKYFDTVICNKIVADIGSNTGKMIPVLAFFKPSKIVSVEPLEKFLDIQKEFLKNKFAYLPKKYITNVDFYQQYIDDILNNGIEFDTVFLSYTLYLLYAHYNEGKDNWYYDENTNEYEKTFEILSKIKDKNVIIVSCNYYKGKLRKVIDDDYINILKKIGYKNVYHNEFETNGVKKFCIIAFN